MPEIPPILAANLAQLRRVEPELAARIADAAPAALTWAPSRAGPLWATIEHQGKPLALASRFDPFAEAGKLISGVDLQKHAGVFLLGFGLGYHAAELAKQINSRAALVILEPDIALLRAVLERVDHSSWLGRPSVILADATTDRAALLNRIEPFASIITQGTVLVTHPPTRLLAPVALANFGQMITDTLAYCRTNVATSLVNSTRTIANLTMNLAAYVGGANTNELFGAAKGYPAVCVGAGPSLARNIDLLRDPEVRKRVVVISAQTTLKPLLDRGIRPDFVTALDYHEISKRFYEGLPELPGVTLVAEPKANCSILDSFPGPIRVTQNAFLDRLLGDLATPIIQIRAGATVAHLSFYLAQHLGCDPIIMIGQDLGFSDGLYYCPGTAIHQVWAPELSPFNTLEMMEWQRIVRHRNHLQKAVDIHGRPMYSDEQMVTYLKQFERDFAGAPQRVLDATEGGAPKQHTTRVTLAEALEQHATRPVPPLRTPARGLDPQRLKATAELLRQRFRDVAQIKSLTKQTKPILRQMLEHQRDPIRMDKLFLEIDRNRKKVEQMGDAFTLVNELNTVGTFNRARADRAIEHSGATEQERQQSRIERDIENLNWLGQACDEAMEIFRSALRRLDAKIAEGKIAESKAAEGKAGTMPGSGRTADAGRRETSPHAAPAPVAGR
ncbi:MAG: DUF115 domain-containing protein [Planctomycetota bacterium]|nr:DUF115 domain-containing protein [Planctomycetota bacterium]